MSFRFQFRRGTTAERDASNPILAAGEPAVVLDTGQPAELVLGDGVTAMADLRAAVWDDDARLALADTATQPGDLGTAAAADVGDFATAAQGALADTATQPGDLATVATTGAYADLTGKPTLGTAAATDATDYASAAQGVKADSASQPGHAHAGADITSGTVAYARLPVGTAASTLAAGDDSRITGAAQKSANLSDLASKPTARANLGAQRANFIDVRDHGATGDGVTDDTAAIAAAAAAAAAARQPTVGGNVWNPGATLFFPPGLTFNLPTLSAPILLSCNVIGSGATVKAAQAYAGAVLLVGHETSGSVLHNAEISLPDVTKTAPVSGHTAGSIGVRVQNLTHSRLRVGRVTYMETAHHYTGLGIGTAYNTIDPGWVDLCKVGWLFSPLAGGHVNQNNIIGGGISQSAPPWSVPMRAPGWRHLVMDQGAGSPVHANTFTGCSFEGMLSEYTFDISEAYDNVWHGLTRLETGDTSQGTFITGGGAPWIDVSFHHEALVAGRAVYFTADVMPGGLTEGQPYFITFAASGSFQVSATPGGAAINLTAAGTNVRQHFPPSLRFDNTAGITQGNVLRDYYANHEAIEYIRVGAAANAARAPITG